MNKKFFLIIYIFFSFFIFAKENSLKENSFKESSFFNIGSGVNNVLRDKNSLEFLIEYRSNIHFWKIYPFLGAMATLKKAFYLYFGFNFDFIFFKHLILSPSIAAGYYNKGNGKDLGFPLEFRSSIFFGWKFSNEVRIFTYFYHISNASLGRKNPGLESFGLMVSIPLRRFL